MTTCVLRSACHPVSARLGLQLPVVLPELLKSPMHFRLTGSTTSLMWQSLLQARRWLRLLKAAYNKKDMPMTLVSGNSSIYRMAMVLQRTGDHAWHAIHRLPISGLPTALKLGASNTIILPPEFISLWVVKTPSSYKTVPTIIIRL